MKNYRHSKKQESMSHTQGKKQSINCTRGSPDIRPLYSDLKWAILNMFKEQKYENDASPNRKY